MSNLNRSNIRFKISRSYRTRFYFLLVWTIFSGAPDMKIIGIGIYGYVAVNSERENCYNVYLVELHLMFVYINSLQKNM